MVVRYRAATKLQQISRHFRVIFQLDVKRPMISVLPS